jgi:hypothetical protein
LPKKYNLRDIFTVQKIPHYFTTLSAVKLIGLIVEVPIDDDCGILCRKLLEDGGHQEESARWLNCRAVHFILPSDHQWYAAKHLNCPHGQMHFMDFVHKMEHFLSHRCKDDSFTVYLYDPREVSCKTDFLYVRNLTPTDPPRINWETLATFIQKSDQTKRQSIFKDFGYTTNQNCRKRDSIGTAAPSLIKGTEDEEVRSLFRILSEFLSDKIDPFHWKLKIFPKSELPDETLSSNFLEKICSGNVIAALRVAYTDGTSSRCHMHVDSFNPDESKHPLFARVHCFSITDDERRLCVICYGRQSLFDYQKRSQINQAFVEHVKKFYLSLPLYRRSVSPDMRNHGDLVTMISCKYYQQRCNCELQLHLSLPLDAMANLLAKFDLDFLETVSLVEAFEFIPENSKVFDLACHVVYVMFNNNRALNDHHRGPKLGFLLLRFILNIFYHLFITPKEEGGLGMRQQGRRFNNYVSKVLPDENYFIQRCEASVLKCLHFWRQFPSKPNNKEIDSAYRAIRDGMANGKHGVGSLTSSHSCAIRSYIGLLPPWVREHGVVDAQTKCMKERYMQEFGITDVPRSFNALFHALKPCDPKLAKGKVENMLCKCFRVDTESDSSFADNLRESQMLFSSVEEILMISSPADHVRWGMVSDQSLVVAWGWGKEKKTLCMGDLLLQPEMQACLEATSGIMEKKTAKQSILLAKIPLPPSFKVPRYGNSLGPTITPYAEPHPHFLQAARRYMQQTLNSCP